MYAHVSHRGALLPAAAMHDEDACARLVGWINANCDNLAHRLTILPTKNAPTDSNAVLERFAEGGTVASYHSSPHSAGGPVLAAWPNIKDMGRAIHATPRDQVLVCLEWAESYEGWASAVGAYNAATDRVQAPISDELTSDFKYLLMWDTEIGQGPKRGRGRGRIHPTIRKLRDAGLSEEFVVTYALGLGLSGDMAVDLGAHFREVDHSS